MGLFDVMNNSYVPQAENQADNLFLPQMQQASQLDARGFSDGDQKSGLGTAIKKKALGELLKYIVAA